MTIPRLSLPVGYAQSELQTGYTMATPQFLTVGGSDTFDLQAIKPTGNDTSDNIYIQTLDNAGYTVATYGWNDWAADVPCWVDDDYAPINDVSFAPGQGLWIQGLNANQGIQTSGCIGKNDISVVLQAGYTAVGNPFPVSLSLQDIIAVGDECSDNVYIQTLDNAGYTVATYSWNDWAADVPCWVDDDYAPVVGVVFAPGQGLWVQGTSAKQSIIFPAPEL